jgi:hypothetical protein
MEAIIASTGETSGQAGGPILFIAGLLVCIAIGLSWYQITRIRDTEQRSLRAYLVLAEFGVLCPDCGDVSLTPRGVPSIKNAIQLRIENVGQTPARQVIGTTNLYSVPGNQGKLPANFTFSDQNTRRFISKSDIGRNKFRDGIVELTADEVAALQEAGDGRKSLFLYGHIDYCDVFEQPHTTAYCFKYVQNSGLNLPVCEIYDGEIAPRGRC